MSGTSLPDEIVSQILSLSALRVPDAAFANNCSRTSPFATFTESTSAYLLVCKSWLRVATPLLYSVIILRSKAQAQALALALSKNKSDDLGRFITKLRVEGGYGKSMQTILRLSPNITDLFLSLNILTNDATDGLRKGLPLINPTRLILQCDWDRNRSNKPLNALVDTLINCIKYWERLISFRTPECFSRGAIFRIYHALNEKKRLQIVDAASYELASYLSGALNNCPLSKIRILSPLAPDDVERLESNSGLKSIAEYTTIEQLEELRPKVIHSVNPLFVPLAGSSAETQDEIISPILYFAMEVPERALSGTIAIWSPRISLLLTCKQFHRLGLPHFYTHIVLGPPESALHLANLLVWRPDLAACITTLRTRDAAVRFPDEDLPLSSGLGALAAVMTRVREIIVVPDLSAMDRNASARYTDSIKLFSQLLSNPPSNLIEVSLVSDAAAIGFTSDVPMSRTSFADFAAAAGASLRFLAAYVHSPTLPNSVVDAGAFMGFTQLQALEWKSTLAVAPETSGVDLRDCLPRLSRLTTHRASDSFFLVFTLMRLPSLRTVEIRHKTEGDFGLFLETHGPKLTTLDIPLVLFTTLRPDVTALDLCPHLTELRLACFGMDDGLVDPLLLDFTSSPVSAPNLQKLTLSADWNSCKEDRDERQRFSDWAKHIRTAFDSMPQLKEISLPGMTWPTVEREIAKDPWVRAAESSAFQHAQVSVLDRKLVKWRPRLKVAGRGGSRRD
uniref:F-box domain-containing protein n=1 Tax=Mycena chlorophos TaxID=658473 RepID=A0ABQ0LMR8_MYCCL|nr:predicted protein [Mycena chlorophos]